MTRDRRIAAGLLDDDWAFVEALREGGGTRPDVMVFSRGPEKAVLKDHAGCDRWFGLIFGPLLCAREARALSRARGIRGVPQLMDRISRRALLMEYLPARPYRRLEATEVDWPTFVDQLDALVARLHECGVAHCDLRSPHNILVDNDGRPCVVDFVACAFKGPRWNPLAGWLFDQFARIDRLALVKIALRVAPEMVDESARQQFESPRALDRLARRLGEWTRRVSRLLFTSR